jgi:hypothetical protein
VACLPGWIVASYGGLWAEPRSEQAGSSQMFHVHKFWWDQEVPGGCRIPSAVLYIKFLILKKKRKERKKEKGMKEERKKGRKKRKKKKERS